MKKLDEEVVVLTTEEGAKELAQLLELGLENHAEYACYIINCVPVDQRTDAVFQTVLEDLQALVGANTVDRAVLDTVQMN
jgi:hypothetical protein